MEAFYLYFQRGLDSVCISRVTGYVKVTAKALLKKMSLEISIASFSKSVNTETGWWISRRWRVLILHSGYYCTSPPSLFSGYSTDAQIGDLIAYINLGHFKCGILKQVMWLLEIYRQHQPWGLLSPYFHSKVGPLRGLELPTPNTPTHCCIHPSVLLTASSGSSI